MSERAVLDVFGRTVHVQREGTDFYTSETVNERELEEIKRLLLDAAFAPVNRQYTP